MTDAAQVKPSMPSDREATVGVNAGRRRRKGRGEKAMVPDATFQSYYGQPIINRPVWSSRDIAGYFFLGGLAGGCSVLGAGAHATGRRTLATRTKVAALGAVSLSAAALVHDLGVPSRFVNMLRVFKPTSPMSVGSWMLAAYGPAAGVAAASAATGRAPRAGAAATASAAGLGAAVSAYTAVLIGDTAVPAWHDAWRELPFMFVGSAASAAGGAGLLLAPTEEAGPARRLAAMGAVAELAASRRAEHGIGLPGEAYGKGRAGTLMRASKALTVGGVAIAFAGRRNRLASAAAGAMLVAASALTRVGVFEAGMASADDPAHTVDPQLARAEAS